MPARFTVAFVPGVTPARWARVWSQRMPDVELSLTPIAEDDATAVLHGTDGSPAADMCFARLPIDTRGLSVIPLWEETPVAVSAKDHPLKVVDAVTLADLADEDSVDGQDEAALDLVAAGAGIATMPQAVYRAHNRRDVVARPIADAEPTRIALVWREGDSREEVQEFIGIVRGRTAGSSRGRRPDATTGAADVKDVRTQGPTGKSAGKSAGGTGKPSAKGGKGTGTRKSKRSGGGRGR